MKTFVMTAFAAVLLSTAATANTVTVQCSDDVERGTLKLTSGSTSVIFLKCRILFALEKVGATHRRKVLNCCCCFLSDAEKGVVEVKDQGKTSH